MEKIFTLLGLLPGAPGGEAQRPALAAGRQYGWRLALEERAYRVAGRIVRAHALRAPSRVRKSSLEPSSLVSACTDP
jgi:hypothetical protein